jgi:3-hydroxy-9,10-secoandrosta-1,3,5(10)-triene-9,17-dione monooxygenase reductase component
MLSPPPRIRHKTNFDLRESGEGMTNDARSQTASGHGSVIAPESGARLRHVLGCFATGVTVVTAVTPDGPVGMVANSFTSVSLDPPLVLFCAGLGSDTWPKIRPVGAFCVNVLGREQEALAHQFSAKGVDRYMAVEHAPGPVGAPRLAGALAQIDCQIFAEHPAGDHLIVVGAVVSLELHPEAESRPAPLIFFRGGFSGLAGQPAKDDAAGSPLPSPTGLI